MTSAKPDADVQDNSTDDEAQYYSQSDSSAASSDTIDSMTYTRTTQSNRAPADSSHSSGISTAGTLWIANEFATGTLKDILPTFKNLNDGTGF